MAERGELPPLTPQALFEIIENGNHFEAVAIPIPRNPDARWEDAPNGGWPWGLQPSQQYDYEAVVMGPLEFEDKVARVCGITYRSPLREGADEREVPNATWSVTKMRNWWFVKTGEAMPKSYKSRDRILERIIPLALKAQIITRAEADEALDTVSDPVRVKAEMRIERHKADLVDKSEGLESERERVKGQFKAARNPKPPMACACQVAHRGVRQRTSRRGLHGPHRSGRPRYRGIRRCLGHRLR